MSETLKALMQSRGLKNPQLAKLVGCAPVEIWRLVKGPKEGGRKMSPEWAQRLAPHLGVTPSDLLFDDGWQEASITPLPVRGVQVRGDVAAGRWYEQADLFEDEAPEVPTVPGKYSTLEQFAFRVVGNSMDRRRIFPNDFVICVSYFDARSGILDGDTVVVERRNGQLVERTVKEVKLFNGGFELWPRSTDPKWQEPTIIADKRSPHAEDGTEVEIIGLVIGRFSPM
jgi:SOS-response transcriptional repressor LexA